ncbi:MAG: hypothetical protein MSH49_05355, partial [[Eubacterium] saphenum]|nr:hypothetical protein [[Eubacterium] saphenum]
MNKKQPDFVELLRFWCSVEPALRGARAGFANRAGVSAKPLHFRRRRTAENARVQSRPKIEELAGLFSVTAHAVCAEFYCWNCFAEGAGDFSGIESENLLGLASCFYLGTHFDFYALSAFSAASNRRKCAILRNSFLAS